MIGIRRFTGSSTENYKFTYPAISDQYHCGPNGQIHSRSGLQLNPTLGMQVHVESQYSKYDE